MMTRWQQQELGIAPGLRDALRSLVVGSAGEDEMWRLADAEIMDALGVIGQARALLEIAEVDLVREGLERGLPSETSWSPSDWVARAEGRRAPDPSVRHVSSVLRVAKAGSSLAGRYASRAAGGMASLRAAFASGELPLGKADQLARFHAQVVPVADEEDLEGALGTLVAAAKDDVVATGPEGRATERVRGLTEKQLSVLTKCTGRLLKPEDDQDKAIDAGRRRGPSRGHRARPG